MTVVCISLISCFPGVLFRYCLSDFDIVPVAHTISGITFVLCIPHALNYYYYYYYIIIIVVVVIIIIIIIVLVITIMHGIHDYIAETNHVSTV
jgi:hypothetical protein